MHSLNFYCVLMHENKYLLNTSTSQKRYKCENPRINRLFQCGINFKSFVDVEINHLYNILFIYVLM